MDCNALIGRDGNDLVLTVRVVPGASKDEWVADASGLRLRIQAPPVDGKANKRLTRFVARSFGVRPSAVVIENGSMSRSKQIRIISPVTVPDVLS